MGGEVGGAGRGAGAEGVGQGEEVGVVVVEVEEVAPGQVAVVAAAEAVEAVGVIEEGEGERKAEARGGREVGLAHSMQMEVRRRWGRAALRMSYRIKIRWLEYAS